MIKTLTITLLVENTAGAPGLLGEHGNVRYLEIETKIVPPEN